MEANLARADDRIVEINVAYWHKTDVRRAPIHVRSSGINGHSENASIGPYRTLGDNSSVDAPNRLKRATTLLWFRSTSAVRQACVASEGVDADGHASR